jgi:hypothetical protein
MLLQRKRPISLRLGTDNMEFTCCVYPSKKISLLDLVRELISSAALYGLEVSLTQCLYVNGPLGIPIS